MRRHVATLSINHRELTVRLRRLRRWDRFASAMCTLELCLRFTEPLPQNVTLFHQNVTLCLELSRPLLSLAQSLGPGFVLPSLLLMEPPCCCLLQLLLHCLATRDGGTAHNHRTADGRYGSGGTMEVLEADASKPSAGCCCYGGCCMQLRLLRGNQVLQA